MLSIQKNPRLKGGLSVKELDLEELKNHIIICGWHRSAALIIEELQSDKEYRLCPIVLIAEFNSEPYLDHGIIDRNRIYIIKDDYTKIEVLKKTSVEEAKIAFILPEKPFKEVTRTVIPAPSWRP